MSIVTTTTTIIIMTDELLTIEYYLQCLADEIANHCVAAARHQTGCCIVQKCLDCSEGEQKEHLLDEIIANALTLSEDTYG